jgi:hypothetical protein
MKASTPKNSSGMALAIVTLIAILATLAVNTLSNFFPPQGLNIGAIANTLLKGVQITPANYAFAIWGLIYLGLIAYGIYQLRSSQHTHPTIRQVNVLLTVACVAQIAWVYLFTLQQFWLSVVAMLAILLALIGAYLQLHASKMSPGHERASREQKWLVYTPFSVYLGWISVATIVNVASALYSSNWDGWGISAVTWTVVMLVAGMVIAARVVFQYADIPFALVFIWAYVAIAIRQAGVFPIWITAAIAAIGLAVLGFRTATQTKKA